MSFDRCAKHKRKERKQSERESFFVASRKPSMMAFQRVLFLSFCYPSITFTHTSSPKGLCLKQSLQRGSQPLFFFRLPASFFTLTLSLSLTRSLALRLFSRLWVRFANARLARALPQHLVLLGSLFASDDGGREFAHVQV